MNRAGKITGCQQNNRLRRSYLACSHDALTPKSCSHSSCCWPAGAQEPNLVIKLSDSDGKYDEGNLVDVKTPNFTFWVWQHGALLCKHFRWIQQQCWADLKMPCRAQGHSGVVGLCIWWVFVFKMTCIIYMQTCISSKCFCLPDVTDPNFSSILKKETAAKRLDVRVCCFVFFLMFSHFVSRWLDGSLRLFIVFIFVCLSVCQPHCGSVKQRTLTSKMLWLEQISVVSWGHAAPASLLL